MYDLVDPETLTHDHINAALDMLRELFGSFWTDMYNSPWHRYRIDIDDLWSPAGGEEQWPGFVFRVKLSSRIDPDVVMWYILHEVMEDYLIRKHNLPRVPWGPGHIFTYYSVDAFRWAYEGLCGGL